MTLEKALDAIKQGKMILLFDDDNREGKDGGGLICVAIQSEAAEKLGLPFISDILRSVSLDGHRSLQTVVEKTGDISYDSRSSFSLWVNHRETFTGIPDNDRTLTINKIGEIVRDVLDGKKIDFGSEFRSPGHVALLRAASGLLDERRGQTELSIQLALMAGINPSMVVCEMLDENTGKALSKEDAIKYSKSYNIPFLEGKNIIEAV
jgi:3,4-dihydroxy 2-butanone 4-phosphate synthase